MKVDYEIWDEVRNLKDLDEFYKFLSVDPNNMDRVFTAMEVYFCPKIAFGFSQFATDSTDGFYFASSDEENELVVSFCYDGTNIIDIIVSDGTQAHMEEKINEMRNKVNKYISLFNNEEEMIKKTLEMDKDLSTYKYRGHYLEYMEMNGGV